MLARACPACGSPLFEVKGETLCVVCRERKGKPARAKGKEKEARVREPAAEEGTGAGGGRDTCEDELAATLVALSRRAREEGNAERCLTLTEGAKRCAEALAILRQR